ncbi:hypothetical protein AB0M46_13890 [Dactylosporangium sp. NPDC051485]|uniref:hypothetical protein n=1 Tax=Dactylosporangium sp. NPDC051485 TaxID=3154846 RepID=UPI0034311E40
MTPPTMICQRYEQGSTAWDNRLPRDYWGAVEIDTLPRALHRNDHVVARGYAVGFGQWFFFPAIEPALAFGRAARMSAECSAYGVYEAARELKFCEHHQQDELVLLIKKGDSLDRKADEVELLKRFVQGIKERPWSAGWHEPTGYLTEIGSNGRPFTTRRRSLPL